MSVVLSCVESVLIRSTVLGGGCPEQSKEAFCLSTLPVDSACRLCLPTLPVDSASAKGLSRPIHFDAAWASARSIQEPM